MFKMIMREVLLAACVVTVIIGIFIGIDKALGPRPIQRFKTGSYVRVILTGQRGMVTTFNPSRMDTDFRYRVRLSIPTETTETHLLDSDDPIKKSSLALEDFKEFEIEEWKGR
jgi:hypothetical protein